VSLCHDAVHHAVTPRLGAPRARHIAPLAAAGREVAEGRLRAVHGAERAAVAGQRQHRVRLDGFGRSAKRAAIPHASVPAPPRGARGDEHDDVGLLTLAFRAMRECCARGKRTSFTFLIEAISSRTGRRRLAQARREAHPSADGAHARLSYRHADNLGRWDRLAPAC
jgi:hypothetical protein